jgi:hypothetical protein
VLQYLPVPCVLVYFLLPSYNLRREGTLTILIFLGIPILVWTVVMIRSLPQVVPPSEEEPEPVNPDIDGAPHFTLDYTGRLWVERRRKGFFRPIRRRRAPPPGEREE